MGMRSALVVAGITPFLLAGCGGGGTTIPIACPRPSILADGADLTRYRAGAPRDLTALEVDARLTGLSGGCKPGSRNRQLDMVMVAGFSAERGPAAAGRQVVLPWFVAVTDNRTGEILNRIRFQDTLVFGTNETRAQGVSEEVRITLPVSQERRANDYGVIVSFELTPDQLELNRRRGPR